MMGSQSLPKGGVHQEYGLVMRQMRPKASDGSLSDTQAIENCSPYAPWLRHRYVSIGYLELTGSINILVIANTAWSASLLELAN